MPEADPSPVSVTPRPADRITRIVSGAICLACLGVLVVSAVLSPSTEGHGTHTQLGMPECTWAAALDTPCLTCGMTTSFSHAGHGALLDSFLTQPMGFLLVLGVATTIWGSAHVALTGSRLDRFAGRLFTTRALLLLAVCAGGAWVYKILTWSGH